MSKSARNNDGLLTDEEREALRQLRTDIEEGFGSLDTAARVKALGQYGHITGALARDLKAQHAQLETEERAAEREAEQGQNRQYLAPGGKLVTAKAQNGHREFMAPTPLASAN